MTRTGGKTSIRRFDPVNVCDVVSKSKTPATKDNNVAEATKRRRTGVSAPGPIGDESFNEKCRRSKIKNCVGLITI